MLLQADADSNDDDSAIGGFSDMCVAHHTPTIDRADSGRLARPLRLRAQAYSTSSHERMDGDTMRIGEGVCSCALAIHHDVEVNCAKNICCPTTKYVPVFM